MDDLEDDPFVNLNSKLGDIDKCVIADDTSFNSGNMADMYTQQLDMSNNHILTNQNDTTEDNLTSGMTKHDSGIYSEKSLNLTCSKDISNCEFSGCFDEGDVTNCKDAAAVSDIDGRNPFDEEDKSIGSCEGNVNTTTMKTSQNIDLSNEGNNNAKSFYNDDEPSPANNIHTDQKTVGATDERIICESDNKEDISENSNNSDENFAEFVRKTLKSRPNARKLFGDDDTESNGEEDSAEGAKIRRNYRKHKSDSEEDALNVETKDGEAFQDDDGTPILLRHSHQNDHLNTHGAEISKTSSDSDNGFRNVAYDSSYDCESEDSPFEMSKFGPPKHKWRALFDLREREFGFSHKTEPGYFRKKVQGSLQMVQRLELQFKMNHHEGCVNALHFNGTGTLLASASDDLNIVIWDWVRNRLQIVYESGHRSNVFQAKFMPSSGDCHIVSCARDGQVRLADLSSTGVCKGTKKLAQHRGAAHKLALEMDSPHVVLSAGEDAVTFEIDVRQDKPNRLVTTKENDKKVALYSIHSNPVNSNEFCVGGRDHYIRIYDKRRINEAAGDGLLKKFAPHHITTTGNNSLKANVTCACYNYNGTEVLGTYNDEDIYLFSNFHSDSADFIRKYTGHRNNQTVKGVNFYGPQSEFVVSGSDCGHVFLWDKETENIVQYFQGDDGGVINVLEPHPSIPVLATSGLDSDVKIWAPTAENPTKLTGIKKLTKTNTKEREEERTNDGAINDGSMLWFIMHHLRQSRRRRQQEARAARGDGQDELSENDEDLTTDESSSDDDDDNEAHNVMACNPS